MRTVLAAAALLLVASGTAASAPPASAPAPGTAGIGDHYFPRDGNGGYDVAHYGVRLRTAISDGRLHGRTVVTATATQDLSSFHLDLVLPVTGVTVDGVAARHRRPDRHELLVTPARPIAAGARFRVVVRYAGRPRDVPYLGEHVWLGNRAEIVTMNQPHIAPWWFPANDHPRDKATFDVRVTVPRGKQVVSNGRLLARETGRRWTRWHWRSEDPMAPYLAFFAAGDFTLERGRTAAGTPYAYAVSQRLGARERERAMRLMRRTPRILGWLEARLGPYPFESTGGLTTSLRTGFALENQTRPTYPYVGGPGQDWLVAHELAHQWFGDAVSVHRWRDIWLNEGFATWFEVAWADNRGFDSMQEWLLATRASRGEDDPFWDLPIGDPGRHRMFDGAVYVRGAMTVQALQHRIGAERFQVLLRRWVTEKEGGTATTEEFVAMAEEVSGEQLDGFFHAWLEAPERPEATADNGLE